MASDLFTKWLEQAVVSQSTVSLWRERAGGRPIGMTSLKKLLGDHFVGEKAILRAGGYTKAADIIANSLPANKKTQSGDLGELLATEYVRERTPFVVHLNKLRWKSDRQMPMHGNDVVAVQLSGNAVLVLKGECKSRAAFSSTVAREAFDGLEKDGGRPNPSTLAFIAKRLYDDDRDEEADIYRDLQVAGALAPKNITHFVFVLSGNDPSSFLVAAPGSQVPDIKRDAAAVVIGDHGVFVSAVFS
jgi:hypothetical protein